MKNLCLGCMKEMREGERICPCCHYEVGTPPEEGYFLTPGTVLQNRYIVGKSLGAGGFGITYIGYDTQLGAVVAVKEYMPGTFGTRAPGAKSVAVYSGENAVDFAKGKERFLDEARRLAQLSNQPEIVSVYDCFEENGTAYIVMEYLDGETLKARLKREKRLSQEETLRIMTEILHGLEKVHAKGLLHRDVAPDNIFLLKNGEVKLFDFGTARSFSSGRTRSLTMEIKQGYSPVEQYRSHGNQGPWTDVYASAATCYRMLTGEKPQSSIERKKNDTVLPPARKGAKVSRSFENAVMNALCVDPENRTQSAAEFLRQLQSDDTVKVKIKKKKEDVGKVPLILKILLPVFAVVLIASGWALFSGTIGVDTNSFLTAGSSSVPDGQTRVKNFVNYSVTEAQEMAKETGLSIVIKSKEFSDTVPISRILSQSVPAGSVVDIGSEIEVVLSAGIEQTYAPWLEGLSREEAEKRLLDLGFNGEFTEAESRISPGCIVTQTPLPETAINTGDVIRLVVSKGKDSAEPGEITVNSNELVGKSWNDVLKSAEEKGFYISRGDTVYNDAPEGTVISAEKSVTGSGLPEVKTVVSAGRERTIVSDVVGNERTVAIEMLTADGLVSTVKEEYSDTVEAGKVISQEPAGGTRIPKGTEVQLTVSLGKKPVETKAPETVPQKKNTVKDTVAAPTVPDAGGEPPTISNDFG